jgi:hypothetical protein
MKLKTVFSVHYVLAFLFGAGFIFLPKLFMPLLGWSVAGDAPLVTQGLGVFIIGTGILAFFAKDAPKSEARRAIVLSLFAIQALLILWKISWLLLFGIPFTFLQGFLYIVHGGLASAYGYFLFGEPREIDS